MAKIQRNWESLGTAGRKMVQPLWKTVYWFLKKLKIELPYDPVIPLLGTEKN